MERLILESDVALLIAAAAAALFATLIAIVRDTRTRRRSLGQAIS